ncbi:MAG: multidrug efflux SMR transporter [Schwartzia sp.]|nr:multidrug efflux SMR transporter [Schwartzia sp. (in: firmicutes)]
MNHWMILFIAGMFEIAWSVGLKYTHGFTRLLPIVFTLVTMSLSFFCLSAALKTLPLSVSYAVWTGIGIAGTAILGVLLFHEPMTVAKAVCLLMILFGIAGLRLNS